MADKIAVVDWRAHHNGLPRCDRVRSGEYGNTSEYLRELIRRDQQHVAERRLRGLIAGGLESGNGRPASADVIDELRQRAFATDT